MLEELDKGFSRTGVQSFALEGILGELQVLTSCHIASVHSLIRRLAYRNAGAAIFPGCSQKLSLPQPFAGSLYRFARG
jgi:hypothetical protein